MLFLFPVAHWKFSDCGDCAIIITSSGHGSLAIYSKQEGHFLINALEEHEAVLQDEAIMLRQELDQSALPDKMPLTRLLPFSRDALDEQQQQVGECEEAPQRREWLC